MQQTPIHRTGQFDPRTGQPVSTGPALGGSSHRAGLGAGAVVLIAGVAAVVGFVIGAGVGGFVGFGLGVASGTGLGPGSGQAPEHVTSGVSAPATVNVNEPFTITITTAVALQRRGPITLTDIDLLCEPPPALTIETVTPAPGSRSGSIGEGDLSLKYQTELSPGQTHTVTITARFTASGTHTIDADAWFSEYRLISNPFTITAR
jgi:hypothetical protein